MPVLLITALLVAAVGSAFSTDICRGPPGAYHLSCYTAKLSVSRVEEAKDECLESFEERAVGAGCNSRIIEVASNIYGCGTGIIYAFETAACMAAYQAQENTNSDCEDYRDYGLGSSANRMTSTAPANNIECTGTQDESGPDITIFGQCPALRKVRVLGATWGLPLDGLPHSLQALDVHFSHDQQRATTSGMPSPLTSLTQLEEASLHGFPDTSLAALDFCIALHSLDLNFWPALTDISSLSALSDLQTLALIDCDQLKDITALCPKQLPAFLNKKDVYRPGFREAGNNNKKECVKIFSREVLREISHDPQTLTLVPDSACFLSLASAPACDPTRTFDPLVLNHDDSADYHPDYKAIRAMNDYGKAVMHGMSGLHKAVPPRGPDM
eukprot:gene22615-biopygen31277